ncbi:iron-sulfur cluster-binding protein [Helicovermis profundi]
MSFALFFKQAMKIENCEILTINLIEKDILEICVKNEFFNIKVGQFFNIKPANDSMILRRPISVNKFDEEKINFIIKLEGDGTKSFLSKKVGEFLDIMGPLGNGFSNLYKNKKILLIGGGVGNAPLVQLGIDIDKSCEIFSKLGFLENAYQIEEFSNFSKSVDVYVEKKSDKEKKYNGNVSLLYGEYPTYELKKFIEDKNIEVIYTCGPEIMMRSVYNIAKEIDGNIEFYASLEERMACGVGACLCCTKKITEETSVCVCKDGPVFKGEEVFI